MSFSLTLPSNASSTVYENTASTFSTLLPRDIKMVGNYESGLSQITFPTEIINFLGGRLVLVKLEEVPLSRRRAPTPPPPPTGEGSAQSDEETEAQAEQPGGSSENQESSEQRNRRSTSETRTRRSKSSRAHKNNMRKLKSLMNQRAPGNPYMDLNRIATPNYSNNDGLYYSTDTTLTYNPHKRDQGDIEEEQDLGIITNEAELLPSDRFRAAQYGEEIVEIESGAYDLLLNMKRVYTTISFNACVIDSDLHLVRHLNTIVRSNVVDIYAAVKSDTKSSMMFALNRISRKVTIFLPHNYLLRIPLNLSYQLGFGGQTFFTHTTYAPDVMDVNYRLHNMYVYTDAIRYGIVGDTMVPILRSFSMDDRDSMMAKKTITKIFDSPYYVPVKSNNLREITVYLRDNIGEPISFARGVVEVILLFRRCATHADCIYT